MYWRISLVVIILAFAVGCARDSVPAGTSVEARKLRFTLPSGWQQVPPNSEMRIAQATIPGPGGAAEMAVFHFGTGQGGAVDANLERWMNQVEVATGTQPLRETLESNGLRITWVDVAGTLKAGQMGMGPASAQPNSRLLGAVIEGEGGPWFFKATGPDATLAPQRDAFVTMLKSAAAQP